MIISDEKVSYRTQVRAPQVYAMIDACRLMQEAYQLFGSGDDRVSMPGGLGLNQKEASWLASQNPLLLDRLQYFRQTALASHFVCGNWKTCDELEADDPSYLSRGALRQQGQTTGFGGRTSGLRRFMPLPGESPMSRHKSGPGAAVRHVVDQDVVIATSSCFWESAMASTREMTWPILSLPILSNLAPRALSLTR